MDVSLVLTHRCNLACSYCFAGEHHGQGMDRATIERATELLYADDPEVAQLSFFGGEPFLAQGSMRHAIDLARARAAAAGKRLLLQVTTNGTLIGREEAAFVADAGLHVTLSIDGVREAHDRQRPRAGGRSSFDAVTGGMRALVAAGARPDALIVITPDTVGDLAASVAWLWSEGIDVVHANLELRATWTPDDREDLRAALLGAGSELIRARQSGQDAEFRPFAGAMGGPQRVPRPRVVVGSTGNLYPCTPMVGEDSDSGPEARRRIGHLSLPTAYIVRRVFAEGVHCSSKGNCACAATIETGAPERLGPNGAFWKQLSAEVGAVVAAELAEPRPAERELPAVAAAAGALALAAPDAERSPRRRALIGGVIMGAGALGFVTASLPHLLRVVHQKRACPADALATNVAGDDAESVDVAAAAGVSDATGQRAQSVLDRVALQRLLAEKAAAQPIPIPKAGPPRHHKPHVPSREMMNEGVMLEEL